MLKNHLNVAITIQAVDGRVLLCAGLCGLLSLSSLFFLGARVCVCRTIAMRLSSLGVLMASVFITINACTPGGSAQASGNGTNVTTAMPVVTSTPSNMTSSCQPVRESCFWPPVWCLLKVTDLRVKAVCSDLNGV